MTITQGLAEILAEVDRPGDYFVAGRAELLPPKQQKYGSGDFSMTVVVSIYNY